MESTERVRLPDRAQGTGLMSGLVDHGQGGERVLFLGLQNRSVKPLAALDCVYVDSNGSDG